MRSIFFSFVLIMVSRILFDIVHLHCSYMQISHQPAMAMVYAMRHCASCALLLPKLILLHSKKQPGTPSSCRAPNCLAYSAAPPPSKMQQTFGHLPQRLTPTSLICHPQYPACLRHVSPDLLASSSSTTASGTVMDTILAGCTTWVYHVQHTL